MKTFFFFIGLNFLLIITVFSQNAVNNNVKILQDKIEQNISYDEKVKALKKLGEIQAKQDLSQSRKAFIKLFDLAKTERDTITMSQSLVELMWRNISLYKTDKALNYASQLEALHKEQRDSDTFYFAKAKSTKGHAHIILGEFDKALENSLIANELFDKIKDRSSYKIKNDLVNNYLTIATVYKYTEQYDSAMESINIALEMSQEDPELKTLLGKIYNTKGDILLAKDDLEKSLAYYNKGLRFFTNSKDSINLSISLKRIGSFYQKLNDFKKSISYYKDALVICKRMNRLDLVSYLYKTLGVSYRKLNRNELALKYVDSSIAMSNNFQFVYMKIDALISKSKIYQNNNNHDLAIQTLESVLLLFDNSKDYQNSLMNIHKMFANLYKEKNDIEKSVNNFEKYILLKETLIKNRANTKTKILEVEYNNRNVTSKLEKKEIAFQLSETKQKRLKNNIYFIISSIVFLFSFITYIILKQKRQAKTEHMVLESKQELLQVKKEVLDREVEFNNKSLTDFALQINEKNKLLEKIKIQLKEIKPANNYSKDTLLDTILFINDDINQNKEKIQLYSKVNKNNDDFEAKINERFDSLSDKERKVTTMVRLGNTSKQIAIQLNISVASVDNYRYIVRKKMKVPKGESLGTFIKSI